MDNKNKPFINNVYSLETLLCSFIPSAVIMYDLHGQVIIHTDLMTDEDGNLIPFAFDPNEDNVNAR